MLKKQQITRRGRNEPHPQSYFQPVYRSRVNYQREKSELIHEILRNYNHSGEEIQDGRDSEKRYVSFVTSLPLKQMQEVQVIDAGEDLENCEEEQYEYKAMITPSKELLDRTIKNIVAQEENIQYLSDYIENLKKTKATNRAQELKDCMYSQSEEYIIIDSFIKAKTEPNNAVAGHESQGYGETNIEVYKKGKEDKIFLSQFYKGDVASHRAIRKTENFEYSKGKVADKPSQGDYSLKTPKKYQISHQIKRPKEASIIQQTTSKDKSSCTHNQKYDEMNSLKKLTHQPRVQKNKKQSSISPFVSANESKKHLPYNYDEEENIFNIIEEKQTIKELLNKDYSKEIKEVFRVRDEERFKKEVKQEGEMFQPKKKIVIKRNKEDLFTGNEEDSIKRHLEIVEKQKSEKEKEQTKVEVPSVNSVRPTHQVKEITIKDNSENEPEKQQAQSNVRPIKVKELEQASMLEHLSNDCSESSVITNEVISIPQKPVEVAQTMLASVTSPINLNQEPKKQQSKKAETPQSKKLSITKIFGLKGPEKAQQPQNLSQIFFANNKASQQQMASRPSTVHNIQEDERSDDRLDMIGQIHSLKENQHDLQAFDPDKKQELQGISNSFHHSHDEQQEIMLSADAISFSKLASATIQDYSNTELKNSLQSIIQRSITEPKIVNSAEPVKKIEIQLDPLSSDEDQDDEQLHYQSSEDGGQVDLDELDDYDSDEQTSKKQVNRPNFPAVLAPVMEEDLEETEFKRSKAFQSIVPNNSIKKVSKNFEAEELKQLEQQLLKDLRLKNEKSDVLELKPQKSSDLFRISKSKSKIQRPINEEISIDAKLEDKHFQQQSLSQVEIYSSLSHNSTEKELINSIRNDISNLKSKIQSSFISQDNKKTVLTKKQTSKPITKKQSQGSISKYFNEHSITIEKHDNSSLQHIQQHSSIDFDKLNQQQIALYSDVKKEFTTLKKKMERDAKMA